MRDIVTSLIKLRLLFQRLLDENDIDVFMMKPHKRATHITFKMAVDTTSSDEYDHMYRIHVVKMGSQILYRTTDLEGGKR